MENPNQNRLLRCKEVMQLVGLCRASIYKQMAAGTFPQPLRIGPNAVRWPQQEILEWIESRPRATGQANT